MRVAEFLAEQQVVFENLVHPPAFTAQKRARFLRVSGSRVIKSVLLAGPQGYFLAVLPATRHIDTGALECDLGGPVRLATDDEVARVFYDCEWGVVAPFGRLYGLETVLDDSLDANAEIVVEANSHAEAIRMSCQDFERLERPRRFRFAQG
jgi:Ala-tRNA(Pro) deacylase